MLDYVNFSRFVACTSLLVLEFSSYESNQCLSIFRIQLQPFKIDYIQILSFQNLNAFDTSILTHLSFKNLTKCVFFIFQHYKYVAVMSILKGLKIGIYIFNYELEYLQLSSQPTETQTRPCENSMKQFSIQYLSRASAFTIHQPNSPEKNLTENIHEENEFA